jgi:predicted ATPase/DNA-binding SARP family transcriptional activator
MLDVTTTLEVATLGRFEIRHNQDLLTGGNWSRRKVVELFKLLLSVEQHRLHREQVQEILWPDSNMEQAANSFGKTLYLLRRAFEPDLPAGKGGSSVFVVLDHDTLMLMPERMRIDADVFESLTKQLQSRMRSRTGRETDLQQEMLLEEFDKALALYKGDYLPEDIYEDWTQRRRDRLRRVHSWLLENAAELATATGKGQRACEYLLELLEQNPSDEQTHRQLMLLYARMGRRAEAVNQYVALRKALKEDLRATPLVETNELFRRIQMGQIAVDLREKFESGPLAVKPVQETVAVSGVPAKSDLELPAIRTDELDAVSAQTEEEMAARQLDPERILKAGLVGREEEITRLQRAFQYVRGGQTRVTFISGEPGIGKSRLASDFAQWAEKTEQARVLWGYCYEMSGLLPYQPIADAITAQVRACPAEELPALLGESAVDLAKIAPEIRLKLSDLPQPEPLGAEVERRKLYSAVAHFFQRFAAGRPLILILDDLQWADAATLHLLNYLTLQGGSVKPFEAQTAGEKGGGTPLYLLLYRTGEVNETHPLRNLIAALMRIGIADELRLQRLSEEQVHQLLVNIAGHPVTPEFSSEIYRHTEGNPFFIGEVVRGLILEGKVIWNGERWQRTVDTSELEIPASVRLVIERRLVNLSPECRVTLTLAAVLGRQFSSSLLCKAHSVSEDVIAEHIDTAIQLQILTSLHTEGDGKLRGSVSDSRGEERATSARHEALLASSRQDFDLSFTHDKIREVLYQWLNPLRRRVLHRHAAQAIEARYAAYLQPYYSRLAYHYQMAEDYGKAVDYLLKAAEQALHVYAFVDAGNYVKTALDLLIGDGERARRAALLHQLSDIYLYTGQLNDAIQAGLASAALWRDLGENLKQAEAYLEVAFCCHWQGREADSLKYIQSALECIGERSDATALLAKAYAQWGLAATVIGNAPEALEKLHQAEALHKQIGGNDPFISVVSLWSLAWCAFLTGSPQQMLDYALQGAEACRISHKPEWEPMMNYSAAWAYMLLGRLKEGEEAAQQALQRAIQHGVVGAQGWAYLVLAFVAIQAGDWERAREMGDKAYAIGIILHDADLLARVLWSRSTCAGWQGDWEQSLQDALEALQVAQREGDTSLVHPHLLLQVAKAYYFAGKPEASQAYLDQAVELAQSRQYRQLPALVGRLRGRAWQAQGEFDKAQPCFERSLQELQALDDVVEYARTEEAYGLFFLARDREGDMERGQELVDSARATYKRLGING